MARPVARIEGRGRVRRRIRELSAGMRTGGQTAAAETAEAIRQRAKNLAPVDTGKLRDSIRTDKVGPDQYEVGPGDEVEYAMYVEYGTSRTPAQPYMRPAVEAERRQFTRRVARSVRAEIR